MRPELPAGYRALRVLRRGPSADVVDAYSDERGARCILKVLRRGGDRRDARALLAEGRLLLALTHPHIVRAYAVARRPRPALVLETLPGETLSHLLERRRRLAARDVARLGVQLASALGYLHRLGFLHLDLKPSNVICHGGIVKLIDLGIARRPGRIGAGIGSEAYCPPEQARGGRVGPASDVFTLGAVLFEAAAGARPFSLARRRVDARIRRAPPLASARRLPAALASLIDGCLDPDPERRPALDRVQEALQEIAAAAAVSSGRARGARPGDDPRHGGGGLRRRPGPRGRGVGVPRSAGAAVPR